MLPTMVVATIFTQIEALTAPWWANKFTPTDMRSPPSAPGLMTLPSLTVDPWRPEGLSPVIIPSAQPKEK